MEADVPAHLHHSRPLGLSWHRIRILLAVLIVIGFGVVYWVQPWIAGRLLAIHARQDCLAYVPPAAQVVFEEDPDSLKALACQTGYEQTVGGRLRWVPACWMAEIPSLKTQGTVFLHQLTSHAGHTRLVGVDVSVDPGLWRASTGNVEDLSLVASVIVPSTGFSPDKALYVGQTAMWVCPVDPKPTRFFSGRPNPTDASRFTFDYERCGVHSTIDGQLNDDDTVTLMPRKGTTSHAREPLMWEPEGG